MDRHKLVWHEGPLTPEPSRATTCTRVPSCGAQSMNTCDVEVPSTSEPRFMYSGGSTITRWRDDSARSWTQGGVSGLRSLVAERGERKWEAGKRRRRAGERRQGWRRRAWQQEGSAREEGGEGGVAAWCVRHASQGFRNKTKRHGHRSSTIKDV